MQQLLTLPLLSSRSIKRCRRRNRIRQPFICFIGFILRIYRNLSGNTTSYRVSRTLLILLHGLKEYYKKENLVEEKLGKVVFATFHMFFVVDNIRKCNCEEK